MANFETSDPLASIIIIDTGELFVIEWRNVNLRHQQSRGFLGNDLFYIVDFRQLITLISIPVGKYTFQVQLLKNGTIKFVYETVSLHREHYLNML